MFAVCIWIIIKTNKQTNKLKKKESLFLCVVSCNGMKTHMSEKSWFCFGFYFVLAFPAPIS